MKIPFGSNIRTHVLTNNDRTEISSTQLAFSEGVFGGWGGGGVARGGRGKSGPEDEEVLVLLKS